ncbi:MAG: hypothetical protein BWK73_45300 [Thiothrix lacustris]|uniref:Uncharacterized protein n=1 Tax=Thiothrix lacustris TaxID=525917 RepID=A0A1Y1QB14_9GAMM|nr:MAG: hypothetical protein BWK73_45300 [Thiothrix lacustris]
MKIEYLDDDKRIQEICGMYWALDGNGEFTYKVTGIAKIFNTTSNDITKKVKLFCHALSTKKYCHGCGTPYIYQNRQDYSSHNQANYDEWECDHCKQEEFRLHNEDKQLRLNHNFELASKSSFTIDSLSFKDAVYLLSIIRYLASEDLMHINPYASNQNGLLSPSREYDIDIFKHLSKNNLAIVSPSSDLNAIVINSDSGFSYYITQVKWEIPIDFDTYDNLSNFIRQLEEKLKLKEWLDSWNEDTGDLCREISLQESLAYLQYVMSDHQFDFSPGDKTILVINKVLDKYSVSQLYNLMWGSAKDAAAYYMRGGISKQQAVNSVVGRIESKFERAIANKWETKPFNRNFKLPISVISQVLYNTILQTDDGGFHKPLHQII